MRIGAVERPAAIPGMIGILDPLPRLLERAGAGALLPLAARRKPIEMPAGAVIERDVALVVGAVADRFC